MSLSWSSTSWRLSMAGRDRENHNVDRRPLPSQQEEKPMPKETVKENTNRVNDDGTRKRYPFTSLSTSGNQPVRSRIGRGSTGAKGLGTEKSGSASFRRTSTFRQRTTTGAKGPLKKSSTAAVPITPKASPAGTPSKVEDVSSDVGSDLLGFGASVEFHEDHRRHIHAETKEIEASNKVTEEAVARERQSEDQLCKDLGHAKSELGLLTQGSEDQFESAKTFLTLTMNLEKELHSNIIEPTSPSTTSEWEATVSPTEKNPQPAATISPDEKSHENNSQEIESVSTPTTSDCANSSPTLSHKEILTRKCTRADELLQKLRNENKSLEAVQAEIRGLEEKRIQLLESMEFQGLQESLDRAQEEERRLQSELQQDRDTIATRITEIQQIRESCGIKAQKCTDLTKELAEAKKTNATDEANRRKELQTIKEEVDKLVKEKNEINLKIEVEKRNLEKAAKEMDQYRHYCKTKEDFKERKDRHIERMKELLVREAEVELKLKDAQQEEQASRLRKQKSEEVMRQAEALKKSNDEAEINIILPGKFELTKLAEQKVKLAEQIAELSKNNEREQLKEKETLAEKNKAKRSAIEQVEELELAWKAKQEEKETAIRAHEEFIQSHRDQIASQQHLAMQFKEKYEIEREAYEQRIEEGRKRWSEKLEQLSEKKKRNYDFLVFKTEALEKAIFLLNDAKKAEREAERESNEDWY